MSPQDLAILEKARDPSWRAYVFRGPTRAELLTWVQRLRYFRFCKAIGGFAQDGDQLRVALRCTSNSDLQQLLAQLGLPPLARQDADAPWPATYSWPVSAPSLPSTGCPRCNST